MRFEYSVYVGSLPTRLLVAVAISTCLISPAAAQRQKNEVGTDAAKADADFSVQGKYFGQISGDDGKQQAFGVQVIALGGGKFQAVGYRGGLPGDGWDRGQKIKADGQTADGTTSFAEFLAGATVANGTMTVISQEGGTPAILKRIERKSPTLGASPPRGATVLFDSSTNLFDPGKTSEDGLLMVPQKSKHQFEKSYTLHLEFRTPYKPYARGQGRGNSGAYLQGRYEVQVLDSFGLEGKRNECGGLYGRKDCDLNMCFPPLSWQTYDIDFRFGQPAQDGQPGSPTTVTVRHNGVVIHDQVTLDSGPARPGPLTLQNHGNPVHYRNIWVLQR